MKKSNKKVKENPIMVNQKDIKGVKFKGNREDQNEIKAFIILIVIIVILIGIIYGLTELLNKDEKLNNDEVVAGTINYDIASVGTILNRPYDEYYVLVYDAEDSKAVLYSTILNKYMQKTESEDYIKIYYVDLGNNLNKKYFDLNSDGKSNKNVETVEDFDFSNVTLLKVEKGKITKYEENLDSIKEMLK